MDNAALTAAAALAAAGRAILAGPPFGLDDGEPGRFAPPAALGPLPFGLRGRVARAAPAAGPAAFGLRAAALAATGRTAAAAAGGGKAGTADGGGGGGGSVAVTTGGRPS